MSLTKLNYVDGTTVIPASNLNAIQQEIINTCGYGTCTDSASTVAKTASVNNDFTLTTGAKVTIRFAYGNTATDPTLNVNGTGAKAITRYSSTNVGSTPDTSWRDGEVVTLVYDTYWRIVGKFVPEATQTYSGLLSATDKAKLDGLGTASTLNYADVTADGGIRFTGKKVSTSGIVGGEMLNSYGTLTGNSTMTITVPTSWRGIIFAFRGSDAQGMYMVNVSGSNVVSVCTVSAVASLTISTGTNSVTIANSASGGAQIYYIGTSLLSS